MHQLLLTFLRQILRKVTGVEIKDQNPGPVVNAGKHRGRAPLLRC